MLLHRERIHHRIYPLRIVGMTLGGLAVGSVLYEQGASWLYWAVLGCSCLLWPHLAYLHTRLASDSHRAEARNLLIDSAIAGAWVPLMHFCLLPSVVLVMVTTFDKLSSGIRRLWLYSLPGMAGMMLLLTLWLRPEPRLDSSLMVVLCTLPLLLIHTMAVSMASYRLIRTIARQNRQLEELRRTDQQTGLYCRDYWLQLAEQAFHDTAHSKTTTSLMMIDIDHFKPINDQWGHTVGDEVIRAVGQHIRQSVRPHDWAGRYGGDEFAVVCPGADLTEAQVIAQRIRERIDALLLPHLPQLRVSSSIGVAAARPSHSNLRDWIHEADSALYCAKHAGRNQVASGQCEQTPWGAPQLADHRA